MTAAPDGVTVPTPISAETPRDVRPMFASLAPDPFDSSEHVYEVLWDSPRAIAHVRNGDVRLAGTNGRDLTPYFPELRAIASQVRAEHAVLDGEIVALDAQGQPAFDLLRPRLQAMVETEGVPGLPGRGGDPPKPKAVRGQLVYQAYDMLWHDGRSLTDRPLWQRKNRLHECVTPAPELCAVDVVDTEGVALYDAALQKKLPGIVAKQKASTYTPGRRTTDWLDVRALQAGDFVIGGYTFGGSRRKGEPFGQLLLGAYEDGRFEYVGSVSGGLSDREAKALIKLMEPLLREAPPFIDSPPIPRFLYWTEPALVCRVRFSEWSRDGFLRFPIFSSLRPDLDPSDCAIE
jgi:bifunctional non-homologous end joining protein LigD